MSNMEILRAPRPRTGLVRALFATGMLVTLLVVPTSAAFTDQANLNLGTAGLGSGTFDIGVVTGTVFRQAATPGVVLVPLTGADALVPGRTVTVDVRVANNSPYPATLTIKVLAGGIANDGAVAGKPNITGFLRFSVQDLSNSAYIIGGATPAAAVALASATGTTDPLSPRGAAAVADGANWTAGAVGSDRVLRLSIVYPDTPATSTYNGGQSALQLSVTGASS